MTKNINKVLIIKTSSMGDIIDTLPAVTDAGNALPTTEFDWVIEENFSQIPAWHPKIKTIIPIHLRFWKKNFHRMTSYREYYKFIKQLKNKRYDIIIDAQGLIKSSFFISIFSRGEKHGMNFSSIREPFASLCYDKRHQIPKKQHAIERIRQLFAHSLKYPLPTKKGQHCIIQNFKKKHKPPYLIFLHNTTNSKKYWSESNWRNLIKKATQYGYHVKLLYYSKQEQSQTEKLANGLHQITILRRLTLKEVAQQIASAKAIISVDTGLSHLTDALERPNLTLYGPTNPKLIGTYGKHQYYIHSKTKNINHITSAQVWTKFQNVLNKT